MVASSKRSVRVFVLLSLLVFVGSFSLAAQPDASGNSLETLISGTTSDTADVLSTLKDEDLPLALSAAEVLKFKSLHGDGRINVQDAEAFRSAVEQKIKEAKTVSLAKTETCTVSVPQRKALIAGQEVIIPAHFRAPEPLQIVETRPDGEAGTVFPEIRIAYVSDNMPVSARLLIDEKPVDVVTGKGKAFVYRPQLAVSTTLSIGTHTASVALSDPKGRQASASWTFTVGVKPAPIPAPPADAKVIATLSVPLGTLFPGTSSDEVVTVTVRQGSDGQRFFEYSITRKGVSYTTSSLYIIASTLKGNGSNRGISFTPLVETMFPNVPMTFSYAYDGPGTVLSHTWFFTGFASSSDPQGTTASVVTSDKLSHIGCRLMVRTMLPDNDPPYIDQEIHAEKGVYPITVAATPDSSRTWVAFKAAKTPVKIECKRIAQSYSSTSPHYGGYFVEGDTMPWGDVGKLTVNRARWRLVGANESVTIEDPVANKTKVLFPEPGVAELVHDISMTLTWGDERYDWTYQPATSSLFAALDFRANTIFKRFPPGIIANTERKIIAEKFEVVINGEKRIFSSQADLTISPPWVLARPQVYPNSPPITLSKLYPVFVTTQPKVALTALKNFEASLKYDGATYPNSAIPLRMYFYNIWSSKVAEIDPDAIQELLPCSEWLSIKTFPNAAELVQVKMEPPTEVFEEQETDIPVSIEPLPEMGSGALTEDGGTIDLLEGYEAQKLDNFTWKAKFLPPTPVKERAKSGQLGIKFKATQGSGTYEIGAAAALTVKEKDTGTTAAVTGVGTTTVLVQPGLKIISPAEGAAFLVGQPITIATNKDGMNDWKDIQWSIFPAIPFTHPSAGPWSFEAPTAGDWTLTAKLKMGTQEVKSVVKFTTKKVEISISPVRKISVLSGSTPVEVGVSVSIDGKQVEKPSSTVPWGNDGSIARVIFGWEKVVAEPTGNTFSPANDSFTGSALFTKEGAMTIIASVAVEVIPKLGGKGPIYSFPNARADLWTIPIPTLVSLDGHLPKISLLGAGRTFDVTSGVFQLGAGKYNWSASSGLSPVISLPPASPGVKEASCNALNFKWDGPLKQKGLDSTFVSVFPISGTAQIKLLTSLDFSSDNLHLAETTYPVTVKAVSDVIEKEIVPSSFSLFIGDQTKFEFKFLIKPDFSNEFNVSLIAPSWSQGAFSIGNANPITYIANVAGDVKVDFEGKFSYTEKDFQPPAPGGHDSVAAFVVGKVKVISLGLKEVAFNGPNYHIVKKDDGSQDYASPHWQDNSSPIDGDADDPSDKKYPICFTRNTKMKVSAKWQIEPPGFSGPIKIKGDGPGNLDFPETTATITGSELTITDVECLNPFKNEVDFFDPLSINWLFSIDGGLSWRDAGKSNNQTYVILGDPLSTVFHTLVHLGCKNAIGENTVTACTEKIWNEFVDRDVRRVDGVQLTYYGSYNCTNITTAELLAKGDGQCGAWAKFFIDMRKVQGIDDPDEYVIFEPIIDDGFIVKNWSFSGSGLSGIASHPYFNIPYSPLILPTSYNWKFAEVSDNPGIPGQGNPNPASLFNNHQVVISGQYYDPSYGLRHASLQEIDDNAIDGFYRGPGKLSVDEPVVKLDLNGDGDMVDLGVDTVAIIFRKNPPGLDIQETKIDY